MDAICKEVFIYCWHFRVILIIIIIWLKMQAAILVISKP